MAGAEVVRVDMLSAGEGRGYTSVKEIVEWINGNMTSYVRDPGREGGDAAVPGGRPPAKFTGWWR